MLQRVVKMHKLFFIGVVDSLTFKCQQGLFKLGLVIWRNVVVTFAADLCDNFLDIVSTFVD